ncbi:zinc transporter ZIP3 [Diaphorina citri]|uniref:Zinc transporter ZIP3 n=1 Tax=Diaphorina citri TaxID=121845 RepID=A0A1S3DT99_DIACI|nr:zinc transporter ZIP3 [Diaphorina citri]
MSTVLNLINNSASSRDHYNTDYNVQPELQLSFYFAHTSNLAVAKLSAITVLGLGSLLLGLCPIIIRHRKRGSSFVFQNVTSVLMYFGGGVLLATTFLHLLPEVKEQIEDLQKEKGLFSEKEFPFAECIMCAGFFMMFTIESIVHSLMDHSGHEVKNINIKTKNYKTCNDSVQVIESDHIHHDHSHDHSHLLRSASLRNFLIVMALSVHEVFEGLALGLEQVTTQVWYLLLAVSCHKFVIALCLGLQITNNVASASSKLFILNITYVVVFALCSPLGIALGMVITVMTNVTASSTLLTLLSVILQGIATGTLMYIVFFEILKPHGTHVSRAHTFLNLIFLLLGFVFMGYLQFALAS